MRSFNGQVNRINFLFLLTSAAQLEETTAATTTLSSLLFSVAPDLDEMRRSSAVHPLPLMMMRMRMMITMRSENEFSWLSAQVKQERGAQCCL